jgi:prevent-host-death family protein
MITLTSDEAQSHFGQLLDTFQREPVTITRHGQVAAFVVSPQDMRELQAARRIRTDVVAEFEAFFAGSDATLTSEAKNLTDADIAELVHASR